jgi:hypothetical protein
MASGGAGRIATISRSRRVVDEGDAIGSLESSAIRCSGRRPSSTDRSDGFRHEREQLRRRSEAHEFAGGSEVR